MLDAGEVCDPVLTPDCDQLTCTELLCGNGVIDGVESCDATAPNNVLPCSDICLLTCGNGVVDAAQGE